MLRRRDVLSAALSVTASGAVRAATVPGIIDVHHHIFPPAFLRAASATALRTNPQVADWSPQSALRDMDARGVAMEILSFPQPSMWPLDVRSQRELARLTNDYYVEVVRAYPGRFGLFAGLPPLTDRDGALEEISRVFALGADGVRVMTSYQDRWLGDAAFEPVWRELDRRSAIVFVHPDIANCCRNLTAVPFGHAELPIDTGRSIASLWYSGALQRYPKIRFVLSHGGGVLPMLAGRLDGFGRPGVGGAASHDAEASFRRLYVDTANATGRSALAGLRAMVAPDRVLFGTDAPFVNPEAQLRALRAAKLGEGELRAILYENARRLLS